jgi:cell shape-determining protein MreC
MLLTWGILVGLIFLFAPKSLTTGLQLAYAQVFRWPLEGSRGLTLAARPTTTSAESTPPGDYDRLVEEKRRVENERANLQAKLQEAQRRIEQLAKLRVQPGWENMRLLPAGIVAAPGRVRDGLIINRGRSHGVASGQFVISLNEQGIVGVVSEVFPQVAGVRLISDPAVQIPVYIGDPSVPGIMEGRGNGVAVIRQIPAQHKVRTGDYVYVQKKPGRLDVPVIAARVTQIETNPESPLLRDITVGSVSDAAGLNEMAVLITAAAQPQ